MFPITRYDPRDEEKKKRRAQQKAESLQRGQEPSHPANQRRKRLRKKDVLAQSLLATKTPPAANNNSGETTSATTTTTTTTTQPVVAPQTTLRVIAPEEKPLKSILTAPKTRVATEAFDDLDLVDSLLKDDTVSHDVVVEPIDDSDADEEAVIATKENTMTNTDTTPESDNKDLTEIQMALYMSRLPIEVAAQRWQLAPFLVRNLIQNGLTHFFPIQALAIPDVILSERHAHIRARDVCIAAPTGSGKTLAFVLPILNSLSRRKFCRLRALVVLPSRDLATQVFRVVQTYVQGSDLKVGLAIGQADFKTEQIALTIDPDDTSVQAKLHRHSFHPDNLQLALQAFRSTSLFSEYPTYQPPRNGQSAVDILVCTPGRLVDHLDQTPGFSLQHLRFLVVDEADRLLTQRYHNWIQRVFNSVYSVSQQAYRSNTLPADDGCKHETTDQSAHCHYNFEPITWRRRDDSVLTSRVGSDENDSSFTSLPAGQPVQLRKFLVSATLTRDPQKLATLHLVNPKHFDAHQLANINNPRNNNDRNNHHSNKYTLPEGLSEYTVVCTAEQKPLILLAILLEKLELITSTVEDDQSNTRKKKNMIVVFTSSVDSTHRLARLLQLLWLSLNYGNPNTVLEFSSALTQDERAAVVHRCHDTNDTVRVVVCSDGLSRGLDLPHATAVVHYDVPSLAKLYVHRCGRTARAGQSGQAISLLKGGQVGQFRKLRQLIVAEDAVQSMGVKKSLVQDALPKYRECIKALKAVLKAEEDGELACSDTQLHNFLPSNDTTAES